MSSQPETNEVKKNHQAAINNIKKLKNFLQGLSDLGDYLEKDASFANTEKSYELAIEEKKKELAGLEESILKSKQEVEKLDKEIAQKDLEAKNETAKVLLDAQEEAKKLIEQAKAELVLAKEGKSKELSQLGKVLKSRQEEVSKVESIIAEKTKLLDELNKQIEQIQAKFQK